MKGEEVAVLPSKSSPLLPIRPPLVVKSPSNVSVLSAPFTVAPVAIVIFSIGPVVGGGSPKLCVPPPTIIF